MDATGAARSLGRGARRRRRDAARGRRPAPGQALDVGRSRARRRPAASRAPLLWPGPRPAARRRTGNGRTRRRAATRVPAAGGNSRMQRLISQLRPSLASPAAAASATSAQAEGSLGQQAKHSLPAVDEPTAPMDEQSAPADMEASPLLGGSPERRRRSRWQAAAAVQPRRSGSWRWRAAAGATSHHQPTPPRRPQNALYESPGRCPRRTTRTWSSPPKGAKASRNGPLRQVDYYGIHESSHGRDRGSHVVGV